MYIYINKYTYIIYIYIYVIIINYLWSITAKILPNLKLEHDQARKWWIVQYC